MLKKALAETRLELDDHRESINQNTDEIQACYDYLAEIDAKLEKFSERLDMLQARLDPVPQHNISLSRREQEVFIHLYSEDDPLHGLELARRLGFTEEMVSSHIQCMLQKGVPVLRSLVGGSVQYSLDLRFKDLQARRNVLNISPTLSQQVLQEKLYNQY